VRVRSHIALTERKTDKPKTIAIAGEVKSALLLYAKHVATQGSLFQNPHTGRAISRIQAYRILRAAAETVKTANRVSPHSLRKTFGYRAMQNGTSPALLMDIYNHSNFAVTRRYLGIAQDERDKVYLSIRM
jgi:integrase